MVVINSLDECYAMFIRVTFIGYLPLGKLAAFGNISTLNSTVKVSICKCGAPE